MERWEGKRVSERENRILSLLRNAWQRGFLPCDKKKEICFTYSYNNVRGRKQRGEGGQRRRKKGLVG